VKKILCLATLQPIAWALFNGKTSDNRNYTTNHRGTVLIYAIKPNSYQLKIITKALALQKIIPPEIDTLPQSAIIGSIKLINTCSLQQSFIWTFEKPQLFSESIPYQSNVPLFEIPLDLVHSCVHDFNSD
jgi:hypothetical protein